MRGGPFVAATGAALSLAGVVGLAAGPALDVSGAPAAQFAQNPTLVAIPANTALDLGTYQCDQPSDRHNSGYQSECRGITDYSGFVYHPTRHEFMMFGGGHATTFRDDISVFSPQTLQWSSAYPSTSCADMGNNANKDDNLGRWTTTDHPISRHSYDLNIVAPTTGDFYVLQGVVGSGRCTTGGDGAFYLAQTHHRYDPDTKTWTHARAATSTWDSFSAGEFDPQSGQVIIFGSSGLWRYDPVSGVRSELISIDDLPGVEPGYANNLTYYAPNGRLYYFTRGDPTRVIEITLNRQTLSQSSVVQLPTPANAPDSPESGWVYDSINQIIGGGVRDGVFHAYDPRTNTWTSRVMQIQSPAGQTEIGTQAFHAIGFDPVNGVFVFITDYADGSRTWAYRFGGSAPPPPATPTPDPRLTRRLYLISVRR